MATSTSTGPQAPDRGALTRLAHVTSRHSMAVLVAAATLAVLSLIAAAGTMQRLVLSRFESPGSQSMQVAEQLQAGFDTGKPHFLLLLTARQGTVDDPAVTAAGEALEHELGREQGVTGVASYWSRERSPAMRSADRRQAVIVARLEGSVTAARATLDRVSPRFTRQGQVVTVGVGGGDEVFRQAAAQARQDFLRAELIIFPMLLLLLLVIYRRVVPALLTLAMGALSVAVTLAVLRVVTLFTDVSTFAANLTLVMGLGLAVDYGLFIIMRFRDELAAGRSHAEALSTTLRTAGHTVAFSGLTVAGSLLLLLLFPFPFLRSFAYAGIAVVGASLLSALVVLPAALVLLGSRVQTRRSRPRTGEAWQALASSVIRHPIGWAVPAVLVLAALAAPLAGLKVGLPDDRVLPPTVSSRQVQQQIRDGFAQEEMDAIQVLATPSPGAVIRPSDIDAYARRLSLLPQLAQVDALTGSYAHGVLVRAPGASASRFAGAAGSWFSAIATSRSLAVDEDGVIAAVRTVPAPFATHLGGYPAELTDFRSALVGRLPLVFGGILVVTLVVLTLLTRSVFLPIKAVVLNGAVMAAMLGVLVWGFQEGHLSGPLGFTPLGSLEPTIPILMLCVAFGLSMDYEVFLLSRIVEEHDAGRDDREAIVEGTRRSAPLVTAAAVVLASSFAVYGTSGITYLKMIALGMALAVIVDATVVRAVLVPAFMRLAGRANWWAPRVPVPWRRLATGPAGSPLRPTSPADVSQRDGERSAVDS
jgi:RND superfamily putative drug exporter